MTMTRLPYGPTELRTWTYWAALSRSVNRLDGDTAYLLHDNLTPKMFRTRRECRAWIDEKFGYIRERPDLRAEPFGWHIPQAVLVTVVPSAPRQAARKAVAG